MTDIPGNIGTDATLMLGVASESDFDRDGDSDWFRIYLNKGQSYAFRVDGEYGSIYSLTLRDANGNVIKSVDAHEKFY
ncbi:PPC domain-containing protein [Benzoatithermus flavus]|uniref:PPC domain-containing protein n=1 Tax=Benzoatithermus flavus TaxID=3108223 RepID=A0ABU8XR93_9PROT